MPTLPCWYVKTVLAGEARRKGKGNPSLVDGLLAAIALRKGAKIAIKNTKDFRAMNCPCENPLQRFPLEPTE
jgi:predicted nucleic acid-binding protein